MTMEADHIGKCLCGEVKIEAIGEPLWVGHCHCPSCQKALSSAFTTYAGFKKELVKFTGATLKAYRSSPRVTRRFCSNCGTSISFESDAWPDEIHLHAVLLDSAAELKPEVHTYIRNCMPWVQIEDGLPQHDMFSGPHE